ncbi:MFS transporter [Virgisporangium ochraceum]|uniref:MFS transporter n=1 Tax=Virgisporangium ochraceum TaxID=65505 RepID=A0A8J3ZPC8_9ACTN|nr:MFS transporter [Virgisporangium ochraceum]GIJ65790.1 MFS transporter [Virgisporangium ochraceum]
MVNTSRRIAAALYAYSLLDDLVLLYPVYALLFAGTGLSVWQITSLFIIWSGSSLVLEVPSGIWADTVSRRLLLIAGPLLTVVAFASWVAFPSYWVFALGFLLWGLKGALASGALEALVYEELERVGAEDRYGTIMGRASAAGTIGVVLAMALAAPALAFGGYAAVGVASAVVSLLTAAVAAVFPEHRKPIGDAREGGSFTGLLRAGTLEVKRVPAVRSAVVTVAVVAAIWGALEEYTPLLILGTGVPVAGVPLFELLVWAGVAAGGLLTGRAETLGRVGFGALLAASAAVLAAAALIRHPAAMVAVAVAFGGFQLATVLADVRLQHAITGPARATVTSLAGMTTDVGTIAVYGCYAVLATAAGHQGAFALLCIPYLVLAVRLVRGGRATRSPAVPGPPAASEPSGDTVPAGSPAPVQEP